MEKFGSVEMRGEPDHFQMDVEVAGSQCQVDIQEKNNDVEIDVSGDRKCRKAMERKYKQDPVLKDKLV